jgi:hypothetical protein
MILGMVETNALRVAGKAIYRFVFILFIPSVLLLQNKTTRQD